MGMLEYMGMAFLGGVILNIMPCVLPVITLKVFHTIEAFGDPNHAPRKHASRRPELCPRRIALLSACGHDRSFWNDRSRIAVAGANQAW